MEFGRTKITSLDIPRIQMNSGASTLAAPSADLVQALMGFPASAGKPVTRATAIRVAAVLSCVKTLANDIAKMPLITYETSLVDGRQRQLPALDNPLYPLFKFVPNRWQTSYQLRWFLASQLVMRGSCFCQIIRDQKGDVIELVPLNAWQMNIKWDYSGGKTPQHNPDGTVVPVLCWHYEDGTGHMRKFYQGDLWHTTSHNLEGIGVEGASMIALGKEAISVLIAAEETAGRNFANGLGMGGFISFPPDVEVTEEQAQNTVDRFKKDFAGSQNAGKFTIIPYGGTWQKMTFNAQESQLLESRKWNEEEIARMFGGAPLVVKLGLGQQNSTYASSSAFLDEYFNTTILPYTTAIEQTISRDLIDPADRSTIYVRHNADIVLRGSPSERAETNAKKIASGQMTPNMAFAQEDLPTIEGGDFLTFGTGTPIIFDIENQRFFIPGQLVPAPTDEEAEAKKAAPPPPPVVEPDTVGEEEDTNKTEPQVASKKAKPKAETRLLAISNALAERVMRKEAKGGIDAKFVAEVMNVSKDKAEEYVAKRNSMSAEEARAALIALARGDEDAV